MKIQKIIYIIFFAIIQLYLLTDVGIASSKGFVVPVTSFPSGPGATPNKTDAHLEFNIGGLFYKIVDNYQGSVPGGPWNNLQPMIDNFSKKLTSNDYKTGVYFTLVTSADISAITNLTEKEIDQHTESNVWLLGFVGATPTKNNPQVGIANTDKVYATIVPGLGTKNYVLNPNIKWFGANWTGTGQFTSNNSIIALGTNIVQSRVDISPAVVEAIVKPQLKRLADNANTQINNATSAVSIPPINLQEKIQSKNIDMLVVNGTLGSMLLQANVYKGTSSQRTYTLVGNSSDAANSTGLDDILKGRTADQLKKGIFVYPYTADNNGSNIDVAANAGASKQRAFWVAVYDSAGDILGSYRLSNQDTKSERHFVDFAITSIGFNATDNTSGKVFQPKEGRLAYGNALFITTNPNLLLSDITISSEASTHMPSAPGAVGVVNLQKADINSFELQIPFTSTTYGLIDDPTMLAAIQQHNFVSMSVDITKNDSGKFDAELIVSYAGLKTPYTKTYNDLASQVVNPITGEMSPGSAITQVEDGQLVGIPTSMYAVYTSKGSSKSMNASINGTQFMIVKPAASQGTTVQEAGGVGLVNVSSADLNSFIISASLGGVATGLDLDVSEVGGKVSGLDILKDHIKNGKSVSISVDVIEGQESGYDANLSMYADAKEIFTYRYTGLKSYMVYQGNLVPVGSEISASSSTTLPTEFDIYYSIKSDPDKDLTVFSQPAHFVVMNQGGEQQSSSDSSGGNPGLVTLSSKDVRSFIIGAKFTTKSGSKAYAKIDLNDIPAQTKNGASGLDLLVQSLQKSSAAVHVDVESNSDGNFNATVTLSSNNQQLFSKVYKDLQGYALYDNKLIDSGVGNITSSNYTSSGTCEVFYALGTDTSTIKTSGDLPSQFIITTQSNTSSAHTSFGVGIAEIPHDTTQFNLSVWYMTSDKKGVFQNIVLNNYTKKLFAALQEGPVSFGIVPNLTTRQILIGAYSAAGKPLFAVTKAIPSYVTEGSKYTQTWAAYMGTDNKVNWLKDIATSGAQKFILMYQGSGTSYVGGSTGLALAPTETVSGLEVLFNFESKLGGGTITSNPVVVDNKIITAINTALKAGRSITIIAKAEVQNGNYVPNIVITDSKMNSLGSYPPLGSDAPILQMKTLYGDTVQLTEDKATFSSLSIGSQTSNMSSMKVSPATQNFTIATNKKVQLVTPGQNVSWDVPDQKNNSNNNSNSNSNSNANEQKKQSADTNDLTGLNKFVAENANLDMQQLEEKLKQAGYSKTSPGLKQALTYSDLTPGQQRIILRTL